MRSIKVVAMIVCAVFFLTGCETLKGLKKDLEGPNYLTKADEWFKENLW